MDLTTYDVEASGLPDISSPEPPSLAWVVVPGLLFGVPALFAAAWCEYRARQLGCSWKVRSRYWITAAITAVAMPVLLTLLWLAMLSAFVNHVGHDNSSPAFAPGVQQPIGNQPTSGGYAAPTTPAIDSPQAILADWEQRFNQAWCAGDLEGLKPLFNYASPLQLVTARLQQAKASGHIPCPGTAATMVSSSMEGSNAFQSFVNNEGNAQGDIPTMWNFERMTDHWARDN